MSPEAIELPDGMRRLKVGRQSDVWSLGCILYQMVYGQPPFQHLSVYQKMKAIPDGSYMIDFPEYATPLAPRRESSSPQRRLEHLRVPVPRSVIETMKKCLVRNPKERATIPELLAENWLTMRERRCSFLRLSSVEVADCAFIFSSSRGYASATCARTSTV
jgi:serine/threonine-protein kinase TTK/MPS1